MNPHSHISPKAALGHTPICDTVQWVRENLTANRNQSWMITVRPDGFQIGGIVHDSGFELNLELHAGSGAENRKARFAGKLVYQNWTYEMSDRNARDVFCHFVEMEESTKAATIIRMRKILTHFESDLDGHVQATRWVPIETEKGAAFEGNIEGFQLILTPKFLLMSGYAGLNPLRLSFTSTGLRRAFEEVRMHLAW